MAYYYAIGPVSISPDPDDPATSYYHAPEGTIGWIDTRPTIPTQENGFFAFSEYPDHLKDTHTVIGNGNRLEEYYPTVVERSAWEKAYNVKIESSWSLMQMLRQLLFTDADPEGAERCKPCTPTHRGMLEIHLGGHSRIHRERFTGKNHDAWDTLQRLQKISFERLINEQTARAEAIRNTRATDELGKQITESLKNRKDKANFGQVREELAKREEELPGKALTDICRLYKCEPSDILSSGVEVRMRRPETSVSDDFNRSDGELGANWDIRSGDWTVASNRMSNNTGTDGTLLRIVTHATALSTGNHYSQITVTGSSNSSTTWPGCTIRNAASGEECIYVRIEPTGTTDNLVGKVVSNSRTTLWSSTDAVAYGNPIKLHGDGSTITYYYNGGQMLQGTDSAHENNLRVGACMHPSTGSATYDDFSAEDLLTATASMPLHLFSEVI